MSNTDGPESQEHHDMEVADTDGTESRDLEASPTRDPDTPEPTYGRRARIIAVFLLLITGITAIAGTIDRGLEGAIEGLVLMYIAAVLGFGIFSGRLETPPIQVAFGIGLAAYGGLLYVSGGGFLWLAFAGVGVALAVYHVIDLVATD